MRTLLLPLLLAQDTLTGWGEWELLGQKGKLLVS
jgi:hypothetical protein